jgi:ectoine hydroxylase-related dioxygenase (phytanoyl-CoA dioxygenase family)
MLNPSQVSRFREKGYMIAPSGLSAGQLDALKTELDAWIEESRGHDRNYGSTIDGKARFDLEAGHTSAQPRLRRVSNPADVSDAYQEVLWRGPIVDMVADLVGPNVKFHHCKLNIKLPGMETRVEWHQDHAFDPHTNDDMLTVLLMLDDMSEDNGCLRVVPGSHRGERYSHYQDERFTGNIDKSLWERMDRDAVPIVGRAGDVCFMHTWAIHGGEPNRSQTSRRLLICDYHAADAVALTPPMVPSVHSGRIVKGEATRIARISQTRLELPPRYEDDSFFGVQGQATAGMT